MHKYANPVEIIQSWNVNVRLLISSEQLPDPETDTEETDVLGQTGHVKRVKFKQPISTTKESMSENASTQEGSEERVGYWDLVRFALDWGFLLLMKILESCKSYFPVPIRLMQWNIRPRFVGGGGGHCRRHPSYR